MIIVSACLAGVNCRYDGGNAASEKIRRIAREGRALPLCPEQLGGLPTPRPYSMIRGGDGRRVIAGKAGVFNALGEDVSQAYLKGAEEVLRLARLVGAREAVLKDKSPACGVRYVYIDGVPAAGAGVCAAALLKNGIKVTSSGDKF